MSLIWIDSTGLRGNDEGAKMKETGTLHWLSPNSGATNSSGFTALPSGWKSSTGFNNINTYTTFSNATEKLNTTIWIRTLSYNWTGIYRLALTKLAGYPVRCTKN